MYKEIFEFFGYTFYNIIKIFKYILKEKSLKTLKTENYNFGSLVPIASTFIKA